jgi:hypothetical protein
VQASAAARVRRTAEDDFGQIRRVELRTAEHERLPGAAPPPERAPGEFWEEDFPELRQ